MKISRSALTLCLLPSFATSFAQISSTRYSASSSYSFVSLESSRTDQGWNNDNFLDALSGNNEDVEKVNEEYKLQSAARQELRSRQLQSMIDQNQDESNQEYFQLLQEEQKAQMQRIQSENDTEKESVSGDQKFQEMMAQAQQAQPNRPPGAVPDVAAAPIAPPPVASTQTVAPATSVTPSQSQVTPEAMEYYQQQLKGWQQLMQGYAQVLAANPEAAAKMTMPQPPPPPPGYVSPNAIATPALTAPASTAAAPVAAKPVQATPPPPQKEYVKDEQGNIDPKQFLASGNNRDAYEITNPADVYLAQLKRDSTVRTEARKRGDIDTANQVFEDVGVKALNNLLSDDLIQRRRDQLAQNGGEFETSRDEMILPYEEEVEYEDKSYTGISYREKLMEMKKKRAGGSTSE